MFNDIAYPFAPFYERVADNKLDYISRLNDDINGENRQGSTAAEYKCDRDCERP